MQIQDKSLGREGFKPSRDEVDDFIRKQILGVVSTVDNSGQPMSATVAVSVALDNGILFGTSETSQKALNIEQDERVAFNVTDSERRLEIQLEGRARILARKVFEKTYAEEHYRQRPQSLPFKDEPGQKHILVTPTHIKFSDCSVNPWLVTEFDT
jgi:general stress protein 26